MAKSLQRSFYKKEVWIHFVKLLQNEKLRNKSGDLLSKILWISVCNPKTDEGESYRMDLPFYWPNAVFLGPTVNL